MSDAKSKKPAPGKRAHPDDTGAPQSNGLPRATAAADFEKLRRAARNLKLDAPPEDLLTGRARHVRPSLWASVLVPRRMPADRRRRLIEALVKLRDDFFTESFDIDPTFRLEDLHQAEIRRGGPRQYFLRIPGSLAPQQRARLRETLDRLGDEFDVEVAFRELPHRPR
jgi:hypothetical protein